MIRRELVMALLAALVGAAPVAAQSATNVLLHATGLSYDDSRVKDQGWVTGFYGTWGTGWKHLVEVGATRTGIDYLDGWQLRQTDLAAAYGYYGAGGAGRLGVHFVSTDDPLSDGGLVLFAGASRYEVGSWSLGAEGAASSYPDYEGGLQVLQAAPSAGFTSSDPTGRRSVSGTLRGYWIHLSEDLGLGGRDFVSGEASLALTIGRVTLSGFGWAGEQAFAVRGGGFTVFNLPELHTGGVGGGLRVVLSPRSALSAGYYLERFQDMDLSGYAWNHSLSASLGLTL